MMRVRDIFFRESVAEKIAMAMHRPDVASRLSSRTLRIVLLLAAVAVLNSLDLVYTLFANSIGELNEVNPLAEFMLQAGQAPTLICFKAMMILLGYFILWKCRRSNWTVPACWVLMLAFTALGVVWCVWVGRIMAAPDMHWIASR